MRARTKHKMYPNFRRCGIDFTRDWQNLDASDFTLQQLEYLRSPESQKYIELEGDEGAPPAPTGSGTVATPKEAVVAADKADVSLPGSPSVAEAEAATKRGKAR